MTKAEREVLENRLLNTIRPFQIGPHKEDPIIAIKLLRDTDSDTLYKVEIVLKSDMHEGTETKIRRSSRNSKATK